METKKYEYKSYKYDELTDDAKETAIEKLSDINVDCEWWDYDGHLELSEKEMKARHITSGEYQGSMLIHKKLYFDIDRGQYIEFVDLQIDNGTAFRKFLRIPKVLYDNCELTFVNGRNCNTRLEVEPIDRDFTPKQQDIVDRAIEIFSDKVHEA